ncbi:MAG: hypothetical protein A3J42_09550 [Candidatus Dadabacteria bacterium RIFCSPHIGHO2_12_FULL_53_21]|nr:MAG: hypothetical protein A3J42_09550 [Candidatus Dadabacteria bacterium RIFCSPHIGHO2_12_FULL_53_21]
MEVIIQKRTSGLRALIISRPGKRCIVSPYFDSENRIRLYIIGLEIVAFKYNGFFNVDKVFKRVSAKFSSLRDTEDSFPPWR